MAFTHQPNFLHNVQGREQFCISQLFLGVEFRMWNTQSTLMALLFLWFTLEKPWSKLLWWHLEDSMENPSNALPQLGRNLVIFLIIPIMEQRCKQNQRVQGSVQCLLLLITSYSTVPNKCACPATKVGLHSQTCPLLLRCDSQISPCSKPAASFKWRQAAVDSCKQQSNYGIYWLWWKQKEMKTEYEYM